MSRAFVNEDAGHDRLPNFNLPKPSDPTYDEAAAWALVESAMVGDSHRAEVATGYRWGEPKLRPHVERIVAQARKLGEDRLEQVAERFLR